MSKRNIEQRDGIIIRLKITDWGQDNCLFLLRAKISYVFATLSPSIRQPPEQRYSKLTDLS